MTPVLEHHPADLTLAEAEALFKELRAAPIARLDSLASFWFEVICVDPHDFNAVLALRLVDAARRIVLASEVTP
jgi:hypothetical protein